MNRFSAFLLGGALLLACRSEEGSVQYLADAEVPSSGPGFWLALEEATSAVGEPGHRVDLIENGRVFDVMVEEIKKAQSSVNIVAYIWRPSHPSDRLIEALAERTRAGVTCRVIADKIGSTKFEEEVKPRLEQIGCGVKVFNKPGDGERDFSSRNHRKLLIVDGKVGVTGGFGVWKSWEGNGLSEEEWRDEHARVTGGPAVRAMQLAFTENWLEAGGKLLPPAAYPEPEPDPSGTAKATFVASSSEAGVTYGERMSQVLFSAAHKRLWISNSYFVPSDALVMKLERKAQEGVDVRVLAPGPIHDIKPIRDAQRGTYKKLLAAGVRIYEYQPSMMHAKTILVDDAVIAVGSNNLDPYSMEKLEEGSLVVEDPAVAARLAQVFQQDLTHAKEIHPGDPESHSPWYSFLRKAIWWVVD
ncbi:Cardiolipin synthetase [Aggregicoccus sp. 17bor-14]|uniref:phospholipase D-like domain-containing protein n=1 Tax=Myxococcaceae TaxID=31 RepID=UPI00129C62A7|nr:MULTISPECIES: phospholipase D-like domain-containing protein [Myxococcaceae]MBF5043432.1 Cardiolipin synthetase [Simulacricoccus sp. 17bor-14]MRI89190.1 Cardiolipin synthetase [Aggregicoccus sp. 17bor-14]